MRYGGDRLGSQVAAAIAAGNERKRQAQEQAPVAFTEGTVMREGGNEMARTGMNSGEFAEHANNPAAGEYFRMFTDRLAAFNGMPEQDKKQDKEPIK